MARSRSPRRIPASEAPVRHAKRAASLQCIGCDRTECVCDLYQIDGGAPPLKKQRSFMCRLPITARVHFCSRLRAVACGACDTSNWTSKQLDALIHYAGRAAGGAFLNLVASRISVPRRPTLQDSGVEPEKRRWSNPMSESPHGV